MSLLLDTHVLIWAQEEPDRIGKTTRQRMETVDERLHVSTISSLEIARLIHVGLLELDGTLDDWVNKSLEALQCISIEISHSVAVGAYQLPGHFHKDPADRVLVSTARNQDLTLVTADERILSYRHVHTQDARS
ncbi:MAG: type II toxin-antitoxin system VapC family toxin [Verrucomicrobia bacterium]|nr:type II toxin-antitoxin system VapC family toxin [Verrucomicrobiota bacterium]MDA1088530.1 type II toxin-antitoxin system VapC family toxin [Verrucomicrobiota bacterium]